MPKASEKKSKFRFILLLEMPSTIESKKRASITRQLKSLSVELPKRNVFILELENSDKAQKIKQWVIDNSDPKSKVSYYQIV